MNTVNTPLVINWHITEACTSAAKQVSISRQYVHKIVQNVRERVTRGNHKIGL